MSATTTDRPKTYTQLTRDETVWTVADIARELCVEMQTARTWRKDSKAATGKSSGGTSGTRSMRRIGAHPNVLPNPDIDVPGRPLWKAGTIRRWAMQTGRMLEDGTPQRLKPPGRPRKRAA